MLFHLSNILRTDSVFEQDATKVKACNFRGLSTCLFAIADEKDDGTLFGGRHFVFVGFDGSDEEQLAVYVRENGGNYGDDDVIHLILLLWLL